MSYSRSIPFSHDELDYEVRVSISGNVVVIRAYLDGQPANGFAYEVGLDRAYDIAQLTGIDAIESLVRTARDDVKLGRWTKLQHDLGEGQ